MALPSAAREHYRAQQRLVVSALALTRHEWAKMGDDFDASWAKVGPRLLLLTAAAQLGAARGGAGYVPDALDEQGVTVDARGQVQPEAFSGTASDGRPLDGLLYGAVTAAKEQLAQGGTTPTALAVGGRWLDMAVHTQIADAARGAASVAIAVRPKVSYVRMLNPPSCPRCAVLAGKEYKWNSGFRRHPRCDCIHVPIAENAPGDTRTDPRAAIEAGEVHGLSKADTKAILEHGADPGQVINAHRGMSTADVFGQRLKVTTEGTTRRGLAGVRLGAKNADAVRGKGERYHRASVPRLRPESIYKIATDQDDAVRLLKRYGYIL